MIANNSSTRSKTELEKYSNVLRAGSASKLLIFALGSAIAVVVLSMAALNLRQADKKTKFNSVRVYCAASVAKPVEQVIESYNREFGGNVEIVRIGGSGELAGQIKLEFETDVKLAADLFVSADDALLGSALRSRVVAKRFPIAQQMPVIAVRVDSEIEVSSLKELISKDLKFGIASEHAAAGQMVRLLAGREGVLRELESRTATEAENVMTLAQALATGSLDAAVIWDTTIQQMNQTAEEDILRLAAFADQSKSAHGHIAIGLLAKSEASDSAQKFCQYLSSSTASESAFQQYGFALDSNR